MRVYLAGPLFSQAEQEFNRGLATDLEAAGLTVYLPQRDGIELDSEAYRTLDLDERAQAIFTKDRDAILAADVFLYVLDGRVPDEGAAVELGIAYAHRHLQGHAKLLVGLHTDARAAFPDSKRNAMIEGALDHVAASREELLTVLHAQSSVPAPYRHDLADLARVHARHSDEDLLGPEADRSPTG